MSPAAARARATSEHTPSGHRRRRGRWSTGRLTGALDAAGWLRLGILGLSLLSYVVVLKLLRIDARPDPAGPLALIGLLRSDVLTAAAVAVGGLAVLALVRPGRLRLLAFGLVSLAVAATAVLQTIAHLFYVETGSPLDLAVAGAAWQSRGEIEELVGSQVSTTYTVWLVAVGAWFLLAPALLAAGVLRLRRHRAGRPGPAPRDRPRTALLAGALSAGLLAVAALPSASGTSFARDPLLNGALSPLETMRYAQAAQDSDLDDPPLDTRLVRTGSERPRNVVLVFLESVRAVSTTVADPELATTPFLAELAETSLVAENAYTVVPHTSKALTAGHCGVTPPLDMNVTEARTDGINGRCLPSLLTDQGYGSAFFQSATEHYDNRRELVRHLGYRDFYPVDVMDKAGSVEANYFGWEDDIMLGPSRDWLTRHGDQPFVTGYLTVTSHHDYAVPSTISTERLSDDPELNDYLNTVRYGDRFVQRLIQQYKDLGLYDDTVFVIMADHGEGFGEHGVRQHDNTIYDEGTKIPLLVHDPRDPTPRRLTDPVQLTAVLPTVVRRLGFEVAGGSYPSAPLDATRHDPVRMACYVDNTCLASVTGSEKYVFRFGRQPDEFYDLATDPGERHNLISEQDPDRIAALRADLLQWRAAVRAQTAQHGP